MFREMNTLKKFSVETHKGWASFQAWIKKWNKIMAVLFSALGITLLLSTVIVNALEVHEENRELLKLGNENPRLNLFEVCKRIQRDECLLYCSAGSSTYISRALSHHWEMNPHCHSNGITIEISSTVYFPMFQIPADWLNGNFKLKELHVDVENIFRISENAFAGTVFEWMQKLVLVNLHLHSMDTMVLQKLFVGHQYNYLTIAKNSSNEQKATATIELHSDSIVYSEENDTKSKVRNSKNLDDTAMPRNGNLNRALIATVTIVGCILSFCLGLLIQYNRFEQKVLVNETTNANSVIFVVEDKATCLRESVVMHNEKRADKILSTNP